MKKIFFICSLIVSSYVFLQKLNSPITSLSQKNIEALSSGEYNDGIWNVARKIRNTIQDTEYIHYGGDADAIFIVTFDWITCDGVGDISCTPGIPDDNKNKAELIGYQKCNGNFI